MKTMRAVCIYRYGGPEVLTYEDAPRPHPDVGEILVQVHAAGINPIDWKVRAGLLQSVLHPTFPLILGWDVSGVVVALGAKVGRFKVGDEIYSHPDVARDGAYAEFIVLRETEAALKPRNIDHVHAAALPLAALTAWQALFTTAALASGQRILIHAAAGGVGSVAIQLAKLTGAFVIGTASAANHDFLRELGADQVIDYQTQRFEEVVRDVDVVFDTMGGETQERSWQVLKPGGILVSIANPPAAATAAAHGVRQAFVFTQPNAGQLAEIASVVEREQLKAIVEVILPLSDATRAQELSERGHTRGKIVLRVM